MVFYEIIVVAVSESGKSSFYFSSSFGLLLAIFEIIKKNHWLFSNPRVTKIV